LCSPCCSAPRRPRTASDQPARPPAVSHLPPAGRPRKASCFHRPSRSLRNLSAWANAAASDRTPASEQAGRMRPCGRPGRQGCAEPSRPSGITGADHRRGRGAPGRWRSTTRLPGCGPGRYRRPRPTDNCRVLAVLRYLELGARPTAVMRSIWSGRPALDDRFVCPAGREAKLREGLILLFASSSSPAAAARPEGYEGGRGGLGTADHVGASTGGPQQRAAYGAACATSVAVALTGPSARPLPGGADCGRGVGSQ
jgi:hypothetical protein